MKLTIEQLNKILDSYIALQKAIEPALQAGCIDPNGPLYNTIWKSFEDVICILDPEGWIMWYIYDNDMGERGMKVEIGDKEFCIENRRDLLEVINHDIL